MKNPFTKAAAKILLPFASVIKKLEVLKKGKATGAVLIVVYSVAGGANCFTFLGKDAFFKANREQRRTAAKNVNVVERHKNEYVVEGESGNFYVVRPKERDPSWRCECPDAFYRGAKCKHQIAVAEFLRHQSANFQEQLKADRKQRQQEEINKRAERNKQQHSEWITRCQILKEIVTEALEKAGIKVALAEVLGHLSIVTNKGWISRYQSGWTIKTLQGQTIGAEGMDEAIDLLKNPMKQFLNALVESKKPAVVYYSKDRVKIWEMPQRSGEALFYIVDSSLNRIVDLVYYGSIGCWELACEKKQWYEAYL